MKVLFAHNGPILTINGSTFYNRSMGDNLIRRYKQLGDSVSFLMRKAVITADQVKRVPQIKEKDFSFIEVPDMMSLKNRLTNKRNINKIIEEAVSEHDILIARTPSYIGNLALKYAKKKNKPYLVEFVACPWDALWNYNWKGKLLAPYAYLKNRISVKNSDYVIYVTNQFLQKRYPTKGRSINLSNVEIENVDDQILKERLQRYRNPSNKLVIGTAANVDVPYKGHETVIRALDLLTSQNENANYIYKVVGSGDTSYIKTIIKKYHMQDYVQLEGALKHEEMNTFYDSIDLYIQPSKQEGLPRAVIEAMSRGLPVFGSRAGGIPELIESEYTFEKGDYYGLRDLLAKTDNHKLSKMAERNFNEAKNFYATSINARRKKFYNEFLKSIHS